MDTKHMSETDVETPEPSATERFRAQTATVREDLRELGRTGREAAQEKLDEARRKAGDAYEHGKRRAGDLEDQLVDYIREKPVKSLLIAAGLGCVLGMFWSRR